MCLQEEVIIGEDGSEETVSPLQPKSSFGEVSILCNIPQPYTVRVCELSRLLRLDKQSLTNILEIYFYDGRRILHNLLEASNQPFTQLRKNISKTSQSIHSNTLIVSERAQACYSPAVHHLIFQGKESNHRLKQLEADITLHIGRQEAELALRLNSAAYHGDVYELKTLIRAGADPNKTDYDGRSPLVGIFTLIYNGPFMGLLFNFFTKFTAS